MTAFFLDYGLFLLKAITLVVAIGVTIALIASISRRATPEGLEVNSINRKYRELGLALRNAVSGKDEQKRLAKEEKQREKTEIKERGSKPRAFVLDFKGDMKASAVTSLREEVSAILDVATAEDEVILRLENPGGIAA